MTCKKTVGQVVIVEELADSCERIGRIESDGRIGRVRRIGQIHQIRIGRILALLLVIVQDSVILEIVPRYLPWNQISV